MPEHFVEAARTPADGDGFSRARTAKALARCSSESSVGSAVTSIYDFPESRHALIRCVEDAFAGEVNTGIKEGFRLRRRRGKQPCAVYWGHDLQGSHTLEIAVSREVGLGPFAHDKIARWMEREIVASGRRGKKHKGSASWPTLGFDNEEQVLDFLARIKRVREGEVHPDSLPASVQAQHKDHFEAKLAQNAASTAVDFEGHGPEDARQIAVIKIRRGQADFRERLLSAWGQRCVVTGCAVLGLLEAAHITPHSEETDYRTSNGLLLRADIHTLYDLGLLSLDERMCVHIADELLASEYRCYDGKRIERRPDRSADAPSADALARRHTSFKQRAAGM